jgi:hypothetical protein
LTCLIRATASTLVPNDRTNPSVDVCVTLRGATTARAIAGAEFVTVLMEEKVTPGKNTGPTEFIRRAPWLPRGKPYSA